ncbi:endonuclease domain-containing protein [Maricaulis parjimensis]|uniref:endonuclease domain-containing protein n=1 Tax=Maricaulis parjimensis TaxID=144023 RepID=UPI001939D00A|nr:endonuclease domain-containing protein [Maricaulis parjimensis]
MTVRSVRTARLLRKRMTPHEVKLWAALRLLRSQGIRFRRQVPLGAYIVDFACFDPKLVIEVDGSQHTLDSHARRDRERDAWLERQGFAVLRMWNHEVNDNFDGVMDAIGEYLRGKGLR